MPRFVQEEPEPITFCTASAERSMRSIGPELSVSNGLVGHRHDGKRTSADKIAIFFVVSDNVVVRIQMPCPPHAVQLRYLGGEGTRETAQPMEPDAIDGRAREDAGQIGPADGVGGAETRDDSMGIDRQRSGKCECRDVEPEYLRRLRCAKAVHPGEKVRGDADYRPDACQRPGIVLHPRAAGVPHESVHCDLGRIMWHVKTRLKGS